MLGDGSSIMPLSQLLISPSPSYLESLQNQQRMHESFSMLAATRQWNCQTQISSPDITRLAADTTAVSLHDSDDKSQNQQNFYPTQFCQNFYQQNNQHQVPSGSQTISNLPIINTLEHNNEKVNYFII